MNIQSIIVIIILLLAIIPAVAKTAQHLKGEGSCCGGPKEKVKKKKVNGNLISTLVINIEGMHCSNCKNSIEKKLNEIEGVTSSVNLGKKQAVVSVYDCVTQDDIESVVIDKITKLGFEVTAVNKK